MTVELGSELLHTRTQIIEKLTAETDKLKLEQFNRALRFCNSGLGYCAVWETAEAQARRARKSASEMLRNAQGAIDLAEGREP